MSILSCNASHSIPAGFIEAACIGCSAAITLAAGTPAEWQLCTACHRSHAEAEARRLLADASDLRNGEGIYAALTADERHEQLSALIVGSDDGGFKTLPRQESMRLYVEMLDDASIDLLADLVSRRLADRNHKPLASRVPTMVRVAIADLSDAALIDLVGTSDEPILLNAAAAELGCRLGNASDSYALPLYSMPAGAEPTAAERFEIEGRIEAGQPLDPSLTDEDLRAGDHFDSAFAG